jgi:hypothetical protein
VGNARNGHKTRRFDHYDLKLHLCYTYFNIYHKLTPSENEASRRNLDRRVRTVSSKFVRTLFELCSNFSSKKVRTFVRRTSNFFESCEKEKRFGIYSIFAKFSNFSKKNELSRRSIDYCLTCWLTYGTYVMFELPWLFLVKHRRTSP